MAYIIHNPKKWEHLKERSCYNHNYYRNPETGEVILEVCDDDSWCDYYDEQGNFLGDCRWEDADWSGENDITLSED